MKIELISEDQIRITLSKQDMDLFHITYDELNYQNEKTKNIISDLLAHACHSTGFDGADGKLYIEVFPAEDAGCVFYISALEEAPQKRRNSSPRSAYPEPILFRFSGLEDVIRAACALYNQAGHRIFKSSLYQVSKGYALLLYPFSPLEKSATLLLKEYGEPWGRGQVGAAFIREHGALLIRDTALDTLCAHFA